MGTIKTNEDALRIWLTGDPAGTSWTHASSLGGAKLPIEVSQGFHVASPLPGIQIEHVNGSAGTGYLKADGSSFYWWAPGDSGYGSGVAVASGTSAILYSATTTYGYVRVTNVYAPTGCTGVAQITVLSEMNNVIGLSNSLTTGGATYRALMLENVGSSTISSLYVYVYPLTSAVTTSAAQLGASGAGTLEGAASAFAAWPASGWAYIWTTGNLVREIIYYSERTASVLTVPALGRAQLGTSAAAGAATDTVTCTSPIRLGSEAVDANKQIQAVADETTAPSGVTFYAVPKYYAGYVLSLGDLIPGARLGLWLKRNVPSGASVLPSHEATLRFYWSTLAKYARGSFRVLSSASSYQLFKGEDAMPDYTAAPSDSGSLPLSVVVAPPGSGTKTVYLNTREVGTGGIASLNQFAHTYIMDSTGALVIEDLHAPSDTALTVLENCCVRLTSTYSSGYDATPADYWKTWITTDGTTPNPAGAATSTIYMRPNGFSTTRKLNVVLGPYAHQQVIKAIVRAYRSSDTTTSSNTDVATATMTTSLLRGVDQPQSLIDDLVADARQLLPLPDFTLVEHVGYNIYWKCIRGQVRLYFDTSLAFVLTDNEFRTRWTVSMGSVAGASSKNGLDVVDANTAYFAIGGTRLMKLDKAALKITMISGATGWPSSPFIQESGPIYVTATTLNFQNWVNGSWTTIASMSSAGKLTAPKMRPCTTDAEALG